MRKPQVPVSVIVPTYNRAALLRRALISVVRQTVHCTEIIVIDDGSTDESFRVLADLPGPPEGTDIRYFFQENKGPAAARNLGVEKARCELIAFLDSDDHWRRNKLERQFSLMEHYPEYSLSHTRERWLRGGRHLNQKVRHIPRHGDIFGHCLELCAVGMSTVMLKKAIFERVGGFDESMPCCEDYDFWLRTSCRFPFLLVDEALTVKEGGREDQVSSRYRIGMDRFRIDSLLRLLKSGILNDCQAEQTRRELQKKCAIYGKGCLKHGRLAEGDRLLRLAFSLENQNPLENDRIVT